MATLTILGGRRNPPEIRFDLDGVVQELGWGTMEDMVADLTSGRESNVERVLLYWLRLIRQTNPNLNNPAQYVGRSWQFTPASIVEV